MHALIYGLIQLGLYKRKPLAQSARNRKGFPEEVYLGVVKEVMRFSFMEVVEDIRMQGPHEL